MKFLHISDLHIGKYVNGYRMLDDQRYMLERIVEIIKEKNPDALLIAGDIYDKSLPSAEAVELFDSFMTEIAGLHGKNRLKLPTIRLLSELCLNIPKSMPMKPIF